MGITQSEEDEHEAELENLATAAEHRGMRGIAGHGDG
jgi:hypothetical protein